MSEVIIDIPDKADEDHFFTALEPWPEPVNGADLIEEIIKYFQRYIVLPDGAVYVVSLWVFHAHAVNASYITPRLHITAPEKQCGKTLLLDLLESLTPRAIRTENITPAVLFRLVEKHQPTLLIDEVDTFLKDNDDLRGAINAGHRKGGKHLRCEGDKNKVRAFRTFAPVAMAGIGKIPDILADRSISIRMQRATRDEKIESFRGDRAQDGHQLNRKIARWVNDNLDTLCNTDPSLPPWMFNRVADNWRPIFIIAHVIGGEWPERARIASEKLSNFDPSDNESIRVQLLRDMQDLFIDKDHISSSDLVDQLAKMEERPWPEWSHGKQITTRQIASLLKGFDIKPKKYRDGHQTQRGYELKDFLPVFKRYLTTSHGGTEEHYINNKELDNF